MRKKLVIIAMAVLALLAAQCKKNEPKPSEKVMVPITGTVDFGGSKTEITTTGCINPVVGDRIYIYSGNQNVGYVNCTATSGQQFSCSGEIEEDCLGTTCTFMYLGSGSTDANGNAIDGNSSTISFANQTSVSVSDGKIANLNKFHVGGCMAAVSQQGTVTLSMLSKMAIAYFQLKDIQNNPIANQNVTISGLSATAILNTTDGTLTGSTGDITVCTDANGSFYMALIPQSGPVEFSFSVGVYEGTRTFSNGIRECNFYSEQGLGSPLQVEMANILEGALPGVFTVGVDAEGKPMKVCFSKGNLQYHTTDKVWKFADNQYDICDAATADHVTTDYAANSDKWIDLFGWGTSGYNDKYPYMTSQEGIDYGNGENHIFGTDYDWGVHNAISNGGNEAGIWRTLTFGEWSYLFNERTVSSGVRYAKATVNGVAGIILVPDYWSNSTYSLQGTNTASAAYTVNDISEQDWTNTLEPAGCVFLPAAGHRSGTLVSKVSSDGLYWSSSCNVDVYARDIYFTDGNVLMNNSN